MFNLSTHVAAAPLDPFGSDVVAVAASLALFSALILVCWSQIKLRRERGGCLASWDRDPLPGAGFPETWSGLRSGKMGLGPAGAWACPRWSPSSSIIVTSSAVSWLVVVALAGVVLELTGVVVVMVELLLITRAGFVEADESRSLMICWASSSDPFAGG